MTPSLRTPEALDLIRRYESRNVTYIDADGGWPMVWQRAKGVHVWDPEGRKYLDLTAAFGVAAAGHGNPRVVRAGEEQMRRLLHAMGDVHPHSLKGQLARELSRLTFESWDRSSGPNSEIRNGNGSRRASASGKSIFCNSGFEAVEAALKTAVLATQKRGVIAFNGAYHGVGYGALNATHRALFRSSFRAQLREFGHFVPFPTQTAELSLAADRICRLFRSKQIGAILVEPIQVRGGINIPAPGFLPLLRRLCDDHGAVLILDEIYTGFGRTGKWFACEHTATIPDVICLGKALTGGFPLSACVGKSTIMDAAWPPSHGEAIHTSTFLGHPVGCAMAMAQIREIAERKLVSRSAQLGAQLVKWLDRELHETKVSLTIRGMGLLVGLDLRTREGDYATTSVLTAIKAALQRGFIFLPEGEHANVLSFTPPLIISERQLLTAVRVLSEILSGTKS